MRCYTYACWRTCHATIAGLEAFLHPDLPAGTCTHVKRFFRAYDGDVGRTVTQRTTHVLAPAVSAVLRLTRDLIKHAQWGPEVEALVRGFDHVAVVNVEWAVRSIERKTLLDEKPFLLRPS